MPSKKKAKGKGRRTAKSRKARAEDGAVGIDSEMQRLKIGNNKNSKDDDDALLEEAINLAAAEREELEAAAKNDDVNNSEECHHGFDPLPKNHVCVAFIKSFADLYDAFCRISNPKLKLDRLLEHIYEATKTSYAEVWNDSDNLKLAASYFVDLGTNQIREGSYPNAGIGAMCSFFFEQWAAITMYQNDTQASCDWNIFDTLCDWGKLYELHEGDEHTLVSYFRKRIPCKCLDNKYKEVKTIKKIGLCCNPNCSLPDKNKKTVRSKMLYCTQCRKANYCSRECQVAHWPSHRSECKFNARWIAVKKSRRKESMNS